MKPSDFKTHPHFSITRKHEYEAFVLNIMRILARTGNKFRKLTLDEYIKERKKEDIDCFIKYYEKVHFDHFSEYCTSAEKAIEFCSDWADQND